MAPTSKRECTCMGENKQKATGFLLGHPDGRNQAGHTSGTFNTHIL